MVESPSAPNGLTSNRHFRRDTLEVNSNVGLIDLPLKPLYLHRFVLRPAVLRPMSTSRSSPRKSTPVSLISIKEGASVSFPLNGRLLLTVTVAPSQPVPVPPPSRRSIRPSAVMGSGAGWGFAKVSDTSVGSSSTRSTVTSGSVRLL